MTRSQIGYAELVRIYGRFKNAPPDLIASLLGARIHDFQTEQTTQSQSPPHVSSATFPAKTIESFTNVESVPSEFASESLQPTILPMSFLRPISFSLRDIPPTSERLVNRTGRIHWTQRPANPPQFSPLSPLTTIVTRLRSGLKNQPNQNIHWDRATEQMAKGEAVQRLPQVTSKRWGENVLLLADRSVRLTPYFQDQKIVIRELRRLIPTHGMTELTVISPTDAELKKFIQRQRPTLALILGDLGCLERHDVQEIERWRKWGAEMSGYGCQLIALVPCPIVRVPKELQSVFSVVSWQSIPDAIVDCDATREEVILQIMTLLSPAIRIEPGLLREIRLQLADLPSATVDASIESEFWQKPHLLNKSAEVGELDFDHVKQTLLPQFEAQSSEKRALAIQSLRRWRQYLPAEIWLQECLRLSESTRRETGIGQDSDDAIQLLEYLVHITKSENDIRLAAKEFANRMLDRIVSHMLQNREVGPLLRLLENNIVLGNNTRRAGWDPAEEDRSPTTQCLEIRQEGDQFHFKNTSGLSKLESPVGSHVCFLRSSNGGIRIGKDETDPFWLSGRPPAWASAWGTDQYGAWADFTVGKAIQRMRWIEPGTFKMGSPEDEAGRYDDEGPAHEVTISEGFWMFDTPCCQDLWVAILGVNSNASYFKNPHRPVENLNWNEAIFFLSKINSYFSGINLRLPLEAEWEFACRARTNTERFGKINEIAWYLDNSHNKTRVVKQKKCNAWGLYDTLGNVFEWCLDSQRKFGSESIIDPDGGRLDRHVIRGGGWGNKEKDLRAAFRLSDPTLSRRNNLGFRALSKANPPNLNKKRVHGENTSDAFSDSTKYRTRFLKESIQVSIPDFSNCIIMSDSETLVFDRITKPDWAEAIGRDKYGLWAKLRVDQTLQQLRWIPPGQFMMGTSEDEVERFDREGPKHQVIISKGFWMFDTPCIQSLWIAVFGNKDCSFRFVGSINPVEHVFLHEIRNFLHKINKKLNGLVLRLPTEAEWEYACRAGSADNIFDNLDEIAWHSKNSNGRTHTVGKKQANNWGLFDMIGNVWEWCEDYRVFEDRPIIDPKENKDSLYHAVKGGSWNSEKIALRASYRFSESYLTRNSKLGFRCVGSEGVYFYDDEIDRYNESDNFYRDNLPDWWGTD